MLIPTPGFSESVSVETKMSACVNVVSALLRLLDISDVIRVQDLLHSVALQPATILPGPSSPPWLPLPPPPPPPPPHLPPLAFIPHAILKPRQLAVGVVARDGEGVRQFQPGVNPWARPHPGMSQSTSMNPTDRAFRPESTENEGENASGKDIPDVSGARDGSSSLSMKEIISDR
ncbi:hypothetical protein G5I_02225 [Acromyrmex echinatior]|uniref:Uncharacterized protein n=1 Tax=Acromyrmex echinatior TaxID=103372 RepID=F4W9R8_ACREC|nr:hypothetical protein G5I_02225 [Acromyrmex echinatior]